MLIVYVTISWFLGLWLAFTLQVDTNVWLMAGGILLVGAGISYRHPRLRVGLVCLCALALGGGRYQSAVPQIDAAHVAYYNGTPRLTVTGLVTDEPDIRDRVINLRLQADTLTLPDGTVQPVTGQILVTTFRFPVIEYGTQIQVTGELETPPEEEGFSYKDYLARQGVHSLMRQPQLTVLAEGVGHPGYHAIYALKKRASSTIHQLIPDPQAALLAGILLGDDNGLSPALAEDFRTTGLTHIIAISGFNIAILIAILVGVGELLLSKRAAVIFAIGGIILYTLLVGADASVIRAALMGGIYLISHRWLGRPNFAYASLALAALLMTLINPFTLWDVGFQLSFAATLSLMLYADPFTHWTQTNLARLLDRRIVNQIMGVLSEAVVLTIAAQVLTLPLMIAYFEQLSLISLVANAFVLPAQPGVMIWGGLATLIGMIVPFVGQVLGWVAWLFLAYTTSLVRLFAAVPGAAVPVQMSVTGVIGVYVLITAVTWLTKQSSAQRTKIWQFLRQNLSRRLAIGLSIIVALLTVSWATTQPDGRLHIIFMDVGQGDATLIQTPSGRQILVDGGQYPTILHDQLGQHVPFWDKELDILVATHPDADHVLGLAGVFDRYQVGQLITDGEGIGESPIYDAVLLAAEEAGTPIHRAVIGEVIMIEDGVRLEIVHPGEVLDESRNENSVSLRLVYHDFTFLLTGDAEERAEQAMLARELPLTAVVFKAGHHGSNSSSSTPFLQAVQPQFIVVSAGQDNRFGHPHPQMLQRAQEIGAIVLRTDELGTITLVTDGQQMWWQAAP